MNVLFKRYFYAMDMKFRVNGNIICRRQNVMFLT